MRNHSSAATLVLLHIREAFHGDIGCKTKVLCQTLPAYPIDPKMQRYFGIMQPMLFLK